MSCLYALVSTKEPERIRYIGISKYDTADNRLKNHLNNCTNTRGSVRNLPVYKWMRRHLEDGYQIECVILENALSWEEACFLEIEQIAECRRLGMDIMNMTDGGEGLLGLTHTEQTKEKIRAYWTEERREKQRNLTSARDRYVFTDTDKQKMSDMAEERHKKLKNAGLVWGIDLGPMNKTPRHVVDRILADRNAGIKYQAIANSLNNENVPTANGGKWYPTSVKNIYDRYSV